MSPLDISMALTALIVVLALEALILTAALYLNMQRKIEGMRAILEKTNHKVDSIKGHTDKMRVRTPMGHMPVRSLGEGELYTCSQCGKKYHPVGPNGSVNNKCPDCLSKYPLRPVVRQG